MATLLLATLVPAHGVSGYTARNPILIVGDGNFTVANGVTGGSGTVSNPYAIEGWDIAALSSAGIEIRNTTAYFIINNVKIHSQGQGFEGILLKRVVHGAIDAVNVQNTKCGVCLTEVKDAALTSSILGANSQALVVSHSSKIAFSNNSISGTGAGNGIYVEYTSADVAAIGNQLSGNTGGLLFDLSANLTLMGNTISNTGGMGISIG